MYFVPRRPLILAADVVYLGRFHLAHSGTCIKALAVAEGISDSTTPSNRQQRIPIDIPPPTCTSLVLSRPYTELQFNIRYFFLGHIRMQLTRTKKSHLNREIEN
jgi:hypothetical protein